MLTPHQRRLRASIAAHEKSAQYAPSSSLTAAATIASRAARLSQSANRRAAILGKSNAAPNLDLAAGGDSRRLALLSKLNIGISAEESERRLSQLVKADDLRQVFKSGRSEQAGSFESIALGATANAHKGAPAMTSIAALRAQAGAADVEKNPSDTLALVLAKALAPAIADLTSGIVELNRRLVRLEALKARQSQ